MRLIDADALLLELELLQDEADAKYHETDFDSFYGGSCSMIQEAIKEVEKQPTAFDVDKVAEELNRIRAKKTCNKEKCDTKEICRICVVDDAIEIVKQGGVSDDVCEWKQDDMCETVYRVCGSCFTSAYQKDFKYCPYCGKKIKIVGD